MGFSEPMIGGTQACQHGFAAKTARPLPSFVHRLRYGLAARWALYTAILGTAVTAVLTSYMYQGGVDALIAGELHNLAVTNQAGALRFDTGIASARQDVQILARAPDLTAFMGAHAASGKGLVDGDNTERSLARVATTFRTLLEGRPEYSQLRAIDRDGREILRLQRTPDGAVRTAPASSLKDLSATPYFHEASLRPQGATPVADFDLAPPDGPIETPHRVVLRLAAPAYDATQRLVGVVVANLDSDQLFADATQSLRQQAVHYIANQEGDYLYHPEPGRAFGSLLGHRHRIQDDIPQLAPLFAAYGETDFSGSIDTGEHRYIADARRVYYDPQQPKRFVVLAALKPRFYVEGEIAALRNRSLLMAAAMLVVGTLAVALLAGRLVRPLRALNEATTRIAAGEREIRVDDAAQRRDEIGDLARSIRSMAVEIAAREDEGRASAEELERSNKDLAQFAYVASHDLQEPLRMVDSYLGLIERRYGDRLDDDGHEFIGYAVDGARRMKVLIDDLLAYSRVSNVPLNLTAVDTGAVVANVLRVLARPIAESGAEIDVAALPGVVADRPQVERLFVALVENALKYRGTGAPKIRVDAERNGDFWKFAIADHGIGIAAEFREKVFEIFGRLHAYDAYPGSGIGLASCRRIVERRGGRIWVEETPGGGATFRFTLPALPQEDGNA